MKLTENWSIIPGPRDKDFQLCYESNRWNENKEKYIKTTETYFYPTFETAVNGFVKYSGIQIMDTPDIQTVIDKLEELKNTIITNNLLTEE